MPLEEGVDAEFQGKEGDFPGADGVKPRIEAFLTKLDVDGKPARYSACVLKGRGQGHIDYLVEL